MIGAFARVTVMALWETFLGCQLMPLAFAPAMADEETRASKHAHRGGALRLGPFYVTNLETQLQVDSQNAPLGTHINVEDDLGLDTSAAVGRVTLDYDFNKRHALGLKWYRLDRSGQNVLERDIQFGDHDFAVGDEVDSSFETNFFTLEYVWAFYRSEKVVLGLSAGLSVTEIRVGLGALDQGGADANTVNVTIPLPTIGGRLGYRVTPKLSVLARFDLLSLAYGDYSGTVLDAWFAAEHHTFKHVGFGGSLGRMVLDVEADDDQLFWDVNHRFHGVMAYVAVYF
jgi:hypothetical protein